MGMGVVKARADEPVAAFEDLRVRSDESLGLFGGADPFDFLPLMTTAPSMVSRVSAVKMDELLMTMSA